MRINTAIAILVGKLIFFLTRSFKLGGGSAAPGYYALKIYPDLVRFLAPYLKTQIVITGTNGKTTTARFLAHFAKEHNLKVLRNLTGSNLERGVASTLINNISISNIFTPRSAFAEIDLAVWELDEAAFNQVTLKLNPQIVVFLNVFRDQLDRYGEVDTIVKKWQETVSKLPSSTQFIINGDDNNLSKLISNLPPDTITFGLEKQQIKGEQLILKKSPIKVDAKASKINLQDIDQSTFTFDYQNKSSAITLPVPGIYHLYDFLAAALAAINLKIPLDTIRSSLTNFSPAFGRVEKITIAQKNGLAKEGFIFLIKNPIGASEVIKTINQFLKPNDHLLLALNDKLADGTDVSWIWDSDFENLAKSIKLNLGKINSQSQQNNGSIVCSGTRAYDLALRLKYSGIPEEKLNVVNKLDIAFKESLQNLQGRLYILPTYTALLELQHILAKSDIKKPYWKEDNQ